MLSIITSIDLCHRTLAILCCNIAASKNNIYLLHLIYNSHLFFSPCQTEYYSNNLFVNYASYQINYSLL
jgi:hypothetical protein